VRYWVVTDTHFGHNNMKKYEARPDGFEWKILHNLNVVLPNDVLIHLGDFCIGDDAVWHKHFMDVVTAKKWLIRGNHDKKTAQWYFEHGWDFVGNEAQITAFGKKILFTHAPDSGFGSYDLNIHGHLHRNEHHEFAKTEKHQLVYLEHDYKPLFLRGLVE
jgi:calcineurin-like phosphoesterase family protein